MARLIISTFLFWLCYSLNAAALDCDIDIPESAICFRMQELLISLPQHAIPEEAQIHDAYDADRDGQYINLHVLFTHEHDHIRMPVFFKKSAADADWQACVRWCPRRIGKWSVAIDGHINANDTAWIIQKTFTQSIKATDAGLAGFLQSPAAEKNQRYFHISDANGNSSAELLFGVCRAWMVTADKTTGGWQAHEYADRQTELLPAMREHGYNVLHQWHAPWEYQLVHLDQAEFWRDQQDHWHRHALPNRSNAYQRYDQGRAAAFDAWLEALAGSNKQERIYCLLAPLPHVSFQLKAHPWGGEGCWSLNDDPNQKPEKCNGFSDLLADKTMWDFFKANPHAPLNSDESQLFDHQANYFRYLIARFGASPAIGIWEIFDEIDAIGGDVGLLSQKSGFWSDPKHHKWLQNICDLFAGTLKRSDGLLYSGDAYQRPLHCASTSHAGGLGPTGNIQWKPSGLNNCSIGWHWYPTPRDQHIVLVLLSSTQGAVALNQIWQGQQCIFLGEFGFVDRFQADTKPNILYPSLYHFGLWSSVFNGHAISAMDWDDGKEYGEIRYRQSPGAFSKQQYPINNGKRLDALRACVKNIDWNHVQCLAAYNPKHANTASVEDVKQQQSHVIYDNDGIYGWGLFIGEAYSCTLHNLDPGQYTLQFIDPWSAEALGTAQDISVEKGKTLRIHSDAEKIRVHRTSFSKQQRLMRGFDLMWSLKKVND